MRSFNCHLVQDGQEVPGLLGVAVSDHMLAVPDPEAPGGMKVVPQIGVIWFSEDERTGTLGPTAQPAPSYHHPEELRAISMEDEEEDDDDLGLGDETEEGLEATPIHNS